MDIKEKLKNIPEASGVYLIKDKSGKVIYIGKAISLRKRVLSHFRNTGLIKEEQLRKKAADIDYIQTGSEAEALLWEATLIKEKQPRYNVISRDDKSYPFLKITADEKFPRVFIGRGHKEKNALYFGPYTDAALLKEALKAIRKIFPYRSCMNLPKKACLYYSLLLCPAPCIGKISVQDYARRIEEIVFFLEGKRERLEKEIISEMREKAQAQKFEEAMQIRDKLEALAELKEMRLGKDTVLHELKNVLKLKNVPNCIEAFDVSHISGRQAVGAMVSFLGGIPDKNNYRRFKIKSISGVDDFGMMREIVSRRYNRLKRDNASLPDLVFIDGGRVHLEVASNELKKLDLDKIDLVSLAKEEEDIYTLARRKPIKLPRDSRVLRFLQRVRDEAHRFAITYHKRLRKKSLLE